MKVKIGNTTYSPTEQPVMIILTDEDKENIANMKPEDTKYACFPDTMSKAKMYTWMGEEE